MTLGDATFLTQTHTPPEKASQASHPSQGKHPSQIPEMAEKKLNGNNDVSDVSNVTDFQGGMCAVSDVSDIGVNVTDSGPPQTPNCAQCRREPPDGKERLFNVGGERVWLHQRCMAPPLD